MTNEKVKIGSISEMLAELRKIGMRNGPMWFRGHPDTEWKLLPSIMRPPNNFENEVLLLKRFKQNSIPLLETIPNHEQDWLFLMQHHGVPTRLLDWTESPLVALYFAIQADGCSAHASKDGALWCLFPQTLNQFAGINLEPEHDIPNFGHESVLDDYLPSRAIGIKTATKQPVAIIAPRPFRRLHVQQGAFTLFHRNDTPIEELVNRGGSKPAVRKLTIPKRMKQGMAAELRLLQIDKLAMFPELENVAARITRK